MVEYIERRTIMADSKKDLVDKLVELFYNASRENLEIALSDLTYLGLCNIVILLGDSLTTASGAMREDAK
jgi:hypothetical protein